MNRKIPVLFTFFLSIALAQDTTVVLTGHSSSFTVDTQNPVVVWGLPNGGEAYDSGEIITGSWTAEDSLFGETPVSIFLSPSIGAGFDILAPNLPNSGTADIELPDINTGFARFRITVTDYFGNSDADDSDGYITIGDPSSGLGQDSTLVLTEETPSFVVDTKNPTVEWYAPNGGEAFESGGIMSCDWLATDDYFGETPITILLSESIGAGFEILAGEIANTSPAEIQLPALSTEFARCGITVSDNFGNSANDYSDGYFTIGEADTTDLDDTTTVSFDESGMFTVDTKDPTIDLISPNGGEHYDSGALMTVEWEAEDDTFTDEAIDILMAIEIGGYFSPLTEELPNSSPVDINLPELDQAFVRLKLIATDMFGNSSADYGEDYFILGDPFGEYNVNDFEDQVIVDWGWGDYELIFVSNAALDFLELGDEIHVIDEHGIIVQGCDQGPDEVTGIVSVAQATYEADRNVMLYCSKSVDYCEEGGDRYPGYVEWNPITYLFHDVSADEYFTMEAEYQFGYGYFGAPNGMEGGHNFLMVLYDQSSGEVYTYPQWFEGWVSNNGAPMPGYDNPEVVYDFSSSGNGEWPIFTFDDFQAVPTNQSGTILGTLTIDGSPASSGDWIAAFDEYGHCVGTSEVTIYGGTGFMVMPVYGDDGMGPIVSSFSPSEERGWIDDGDMVIQTRSFDTFNIYRDNVLVAESSNDYFYLDEEVDEGGEYCYTVVLLDDEGNELITSIEQCVTVGEGGPSQLSVEYNSGWNMVGLPVLVDDAYYQTLFPEAYTGALYSYNNSYQLETTLIPGTGYLLRLASGGTTSFSGLLINALTLSITEGWNLISGISTPVDADVLYNSGLVVTGGIYGYDASYFNADVINPGMGYWVRAIQDGEITFSSTALAAKTLAQINHLEGSNTLELSNGTQSSTLYFGKDVAEENRNSYSLPPTFPQMAFDVRFNGDMKYTVESGDIEVLNISDNLSISYDVVLDAGEHMDWVLTSESGKDYVLEGSGEITIPTEETFTLERKAIIPIAFTLHQNYPNPFNPITSLRYDLPEQAQVILTVYDLMGREVTQLVNTTQEAGYRSVQWNATDSFGKPVSAGVYLYQIRAGEFVQTKKMVLLK